MKLEICFCLTTEINLFISLVIFMYMYYSVTVGASKYINLDLTKAHRDSGESATKL